MVLPSLPGYGFSGKPASADWDIHRIARAWAELMTRLGYRRFLAMGSDWGTSISTSLALQHPAGWWTSTWCRRWCRPTAPPVISPAAGAPRWRPRSANPHRIRLLGHPGHPAADHRLLADRFTSRAMRLDRGETVALDRPPRRPRPGPDRRWAQRRFTNIVHWNQPGSGGHFAAWEQPDLFAAEMRAAFKSLR